MRIKFTSILLFIVLIVKTGAVMAGSAAAEKNAKRNSPAPAVPAYGFIENNGQVLNQFNEANTDILFVYKSDGFNIQLRKNGFSYELKKLSKESNADKPLDRHEVPDDAEYKVHRIDIGFKNSLPAKQVTRYEKGEGMLRYFSSASGTPVSIDCGHFHKIVYSGIYPGIDIEFLVDPTAGTAGVNELAAVRSFKYNFIVHPGADISNIRLEFNGALETKLTGKGNIQIKTSIADFEEQIPYSYQYTKDDDRSEVKVSYDEISPNVYGIKAIGYNNAATLVVDPAPWCTYFGGSGNEVCYGNTTDASGNIYITGYSTSTTAIATSGAYQTIIGGSADCFLAKFSSSGSLIWATYMGGNASEYGYALAADVSGNVFMCGWTTSASFPVTSGAHQGTTGGSNDGFVCKFNSSGALQWSTYYGGDQAEFAYSIATDPSGNVIVAGQTASTVFISSSGAYMASHQGGGNDAFIVKFNNDGTRQWATYFGGSGSDYGEGVAVDLSGNIYITGNTTSTSGIASLSAHQTIQAGNADVYLAKFSSAGSFIWASYYGGANGDFGKEVACDVNGNVYFCGYTSSSTDISTTGAFQENVAGSNDAFLAKFTSAGVRLWATYAGGPSSEQGYSVCVDPVTSDVYLAGYGNSTSGIATTGAYQSTIGGGYDAFIFKFSSNGANQWGTYLGGTSTDQVWHVSSGVNGGMVASGHTYSTTGIATSGAYQSSLALLNDAFLFVIPPAGAIPINGNTISADQALCLGGSPALLQGSFPGGGDGSFVYTWMESTSGIDGTFIPANGSNGGLDYQPPSLSSTMYYRRIVVSGAFADTSNMVIIAVSTVALHVGFTINKQIQCIKDNQFIFTDTTSVSGGPPLTRLWTFSNGFTSTQPSEVMSFTFNVANSYTVKLVNSIAGACADSVTKTIYLTNNPVTGSISGNIYVDRLSTITYSVPAKIGSSFKWFFDNGTGTSTTNSIKIKWTVTGVATIKVLETSSGGCPGDTVMLTVFIGPSVGIDESMQVDLITVYPNPTNGMVNVSGFNMKLITLYDMQGRLVYSNAQPLSDEHIDLGSFNNGMYMLDITDENDRIQHHKIELIK